MLCGHMHNGSDGAAYLAGTGTGGAGQTIHIVQADYQDMSNGNGWLRLFRFSPTNDLIYMTTYSPYTGGSITSTSNYDQADLVYDMPGAPAYQLIGTVTGVASGANASISWSGLSPSTAYEWYAVANDGAAGPNSATWSFTTAALAVPEAPVVSSITQGSGNVNLGWGAVTKDMNNNGTTIDEYRVYGSQEPYFTAGTLLPPTSASHDIHAHGRRDRHDQLVLPGARPQQHRRVGELRPAHRPVRVHAGAGGRIVSAGPLVAARLRCYCRDLCTVLTPTRGHATSLKISVAGVGGHSDDPVFCKVSPLSSKQTEDAMTAHSRVTGTLPRKGT